VPESNEPRDRLRAAASILEAVPRPAQTDRPQAIPQLAEQVKRALAGIGLPAWEAFLQELKQELHRPSSPVAAQQPPDRRELESEDAERLADRLADVAPFLPESIRQQIRAKLAAAGLICAEPGVSSQSSASAGVWTALPADDLRARFQLDSMDQPDPARLAEVAALYHELICHLEQVIWGTWRTVAPRSALRPGSLLRKTVARYISTDATATRDQVSADIAQLRRLSAALIAAVGQLGRVLSGNCYEHLSPEMIQDAVAREPRSMFASMEARCWKKYCELHAETQAMSIDQQIMDTLGRITAEMLEVPARA